VKNPRLRNTLLAAAALAALGAGTAVAVLSRGGRDVTTSSSEAYEAYQKGREDERRIYSKDALASYAKALELDPHFTMATLRLAGIVAGRDRERAKSLVQCAARNHGPLNPREELTLAIVSADVLERNQKKVGELVREYVQRFPDDPEGYFRLAGVLAREGKTEETRATYERLLALDPNQAIAYNYLGYWFIGRRDFVKGEDYLKRYRFLAPEQANPYDSLGELYANTGRYDESEEHLRRALEIKPDFFPAVGHLGTLEIGRGNPAAAAEWFRRAAEMSETWKDKHNFAGAAVTALLDAGKPEEALELLDKAGAEVPELTGREAFVFRFHLGRSRAVVLALGKRPAEAEAELEKLPAFPDDLDPKDRASLERSLAGPKAAIAGAKGDLEAAVALLRELLAEDKERSAGDFPYYPSVFRVRARLADALVTLGRPDEAREELRPVLSVNPRFAPALAVLTRIDGRERAPEGTAGR
jgi:tetratricopeptide (TPR) repeat protein